MTDLSEAILAAATPHPLVAALVCDTGSNDPAQMATNYFIGLVNEPDSVALAGYLDDVHGIGAAAGLNAFGDKLQEHLERVVRLVKDGDVTVRSGAFNDASRKLSEARSVLDLLGQISEDDHQGLAAHTMQGAAILAHRLVAEAFMLLTDPYGDYSEESSDD